ncbi:MAG: hypothetical protein IKG56_04935 [Clostridia bacterium]|nr:hypothetical protein [Clostridia bacterium]
MEKAPIIPNSVTDISYTFKDCSKLTGDLIINMNNLEKWAKSLNGAATVEGCDLKISGSASSTILTKILNTKSANSHISLK